MKRVSWIIISTIILLLTTDLSVKAQDISGYVRDQKTGEGLAGANIIIPHLKKGTSTNQQGFYRIPGLSSQLLEIRFSHVGYHDTTLTIKPKIGNTLDVFLLPDSIEFTSVVVTATRTRKPVEEVPQRVNVIDSESIEHYPATNTDDLLKMIPGIVVNRSWGIFSRNAAVNMRGMPGSSRSLILLDGIPLNKSAGGTVNWHLVSPEEIERIEVVKGPGSTLYGNNAMGGVINIITRNQKQKFYGNASLGVGSYNTLKGQLLMGGNHITKATGFYWKLGSFYRKGDGYILEPEESRTPISSKAFLQEGNAAGLIGYQFGNAHKLELDYRFYSDKRGSGITVYETDGSYESFTNNNIKIEYDRYIGKTRMIVKSFYLNEFYFRQNENVNKSGEYKLLDTETSKNDVGLWLNFSRPVGQHQNLTFGVDVKHGDLNNNEIYRTSTDAIQTRGKLLFTAGFLQDEIKLMREKLIVTVGARLDQVQFYKGYLNVTDPTDRTGFPSELKQSFETSSWMEISPKVAAKYFIFSSLSTFVSASSGFMPPRLDDLAGSRKIRRGFKKANPDLAPETLRSIEWGFSYDKEQIISIKPSLFYSRGYDFQYLAATGDFIDSGSEEPLPVYQRQNVSEVEVYGAEAGIHFKPHRKIRLTANYTYNHSKIIDYASKGEFDLSGKYLNEVPANMVFLGFDWQNNIADLYINYTFTDEQWFDEENTEVVESYSLVNVRLSKRILRQFVVSLDVQDLLDEQFIDRKGYLSPGRFFMMEIKYLFNN